MTAVHITTLVPEPTIKPRGAAIAGLVFNLVFGALAWNRARTLRQRRQRDAISLRSYANSIRHSEPSLAADLLAAADRAA